MSQGQGTRHNNHNLKGQMYFTHFRKQNGNRVVFKSKESFFKSCPLTDLFGHWLHKQETILYSPPPNSRLLQNAGCQLSSHGFYGGNKSIPGTAPLPELEQVTRAAPGQNLNGQRFYHQLGLLTTERPLCCSTATSTETKSHAAILPLALDTHSFS